VDRHAGGKRKQPKTAIAGPKISWFSLSL
jgi:hypothetical protein